MILAMENAALDAIRVAAIANNAPVSYGALGAPIIALAAVTGMPLLALAGSVGKIVAILALLPPWILLYLVSGREGMKGAWPLAIVGSLGYIAGQLPTSVYLGPYLPDVIGAIVCFACLLILLKIWRPAQTLGYGGVPISAAEEAQAEAHGLSVRELVNGDARAVVRELKAVGADLKAIRLAFTGRTRRRELETIIDALPRDEALRRIDAAL